MEFSQLINSQMISLDKSKLNVARIHDYIANSSYWGKGRAIEEVKASIEHSICFGVYIDGEQVAFARVVSDTVAFAYLMDVIVFEQYQGNGIGTQLMEEVLNHPHFKTVNWLLRTSDAQKLYEKFGFSKIVDSSNYMRKFSG
ncbi:MAG: GNAT family N-acetyltransferase [Alteromonadales bacterium]|nr:GNAT family N-acetyltransferase [Alteromonadales bacterium]